MPNQTSDLYTIKDISEITGVHPQTLRNWEKENLIEPIRVAGNQRIYTNEHINRINEIINLKEEGMQLKGVRNMLLGKSTAKKKTTTARGTMKQREAKPLMSAAQTLEKTGAKKRGRPAKNVGTPTAAENAKYSLEDLQSKTLKELTDIAQEEGVKYFRQMFKDELIIAIADPSRRDEMKEQAKARTKERYGAKVYGERRRKMEDQGETSERVVSYAQSTEENKTPQVTEESEATKEGLVEANVVEDAQEEMDNQQELIQQILKLGEQGKSPEEIAKHLVSSFK